ncbi:MAG: hypothetical protein ACYC1D_12750 [Acidimicrobiales bacterium]
MSRSHGHRRPAWLVVVAALLGGLAASVVPATPVAAAAHASPVLRSPLSSALSITSGYWEVTADGGVYGFGTANMGELRVGSLNAPIVGSAATPDGGGYWLVASDGGIFSFGDAGFYGSAGNISLNRPIVGMAPTPDGRGYWLVASDGGVFSYGDARFYGSTGNIVLNRPVVGVAAAPGGGGYWLVASDGGIFSFGAVRFYGSTGNIALNRPIVGMAAAPGGDGYWLVASDGGIFSFGAVRFYGSTGNIVLNRPVVGMAAAPGGGGYWLVASDGGIFNFGDARFEGSAAALGGLAPVVSISVTPRGFLYPVGSTGWDVSNYQCPTGLPAGRAFAVVEVAGAINGYANSCYAYEAAWAGPNMAAYIFMNGLPAPAPAESLAGPAGTCNGDVNCESYNFGWYWARHWVSHSEALGVDPTVWWLDVEGPCAYWQCGVVAGNAQVISGAVQALRSLGLTAGIYSTPLQWGEIAGSLAFPGIPVWAAGAGNVTGGYYSAVSYCTNDAFAGGTVTLVQYGYTGGGYTGPAVADDQDYACL